MSVPIGVPVMDANPVTEWFAIRHAPDDESLPWSIPLPDNAEIDAWDRSIVRQIGAPYLQKLAGCKRYPVPLFELEDTPCPPSTGFGFSRSSESFYSSCSPWE